MYTEKERTEGGWCVESCTLTLPPAHAYAHACVAPCRGRRRTSSCLEVRSLVRWHASLVCRGVNLPFHLRQEEKFYGFHPWALEDGVERGGGKAMAAAAEGKEGVEDWSFDDDDFEGGVGDDDAEVRHGVQQHSQVSRFGQHVCMSWSNRGVRYMRVSTGFCW